MNFFLSRKSANISFNDTRVGVVSVRNEMIVLLIVYRVFVRKFNLTDEKALEMSQISKDNTHMLQKNSSRNLCEECMNLFWVNVLKPLNIDLDK